MLVRDVDEENYWQKLNVEPRMLKYVLPIISYCMMQRPSAHVKVHDSSSLDFFKHFFSVALYTDDSSLHLHSGDPKRLYDQMHRPPGQ